MVIIDCTQLNNHFLALKYYFKSCYLLLLLLLSCKNYFEMAMKPWGKNKTICNWTTLFQGFIYKHL